MDIDSILNDYTETKDCLYKGEHYSVRDNGAVFRHAQNSSKPRKLDGQWTFGKKNEATGYMNIGSHRVHIIVATAFYGSHDSTKDVVDHIDTNRCNNRVNNLRWLTRLENALNNPATRKKITYLCGGDIQKFIDNPNCLRDLTGTNQDVMWMRTVSNEEAKAAYQRVMKWAQEPTQPVSEKKGIGGWIYTPIQDYNRNRNNVTFEGKSHQRIDLLEQLNPIDEIVSETNCLTESLTPNAKQRAWKTPTEFPLCPSVWDEKPLIAYLNNLEKGAIVTKNRYATHFIDDFVLYNDSVILIRTHADEGIKKYSTISITFENGVYIHEGETFFEEQGAEKALTLRQGLEWDGEDGIDDYC